MPSSSDYNDERHKKEEAARRERRKVSRLQCSSVCFILTNAGFYAQKMPMFLIFAFFAKHCVSHPSQSATDRTQNTKNQKPSERKKGNEKSTPKKFSRNTAEKSKRRHPNRHRPHFRHFSNNGRRDLKLHSSSEMLPLGPRLVPVLLVPI